MARIIPGTRALDMRQAHKSRATGAAWQAEELRRAAEYREWIESLQRNQVAAIAEAAAAAAIRRLQARR